MTTLDYSNAHHVQNNANLLHSTPESSSRSVPNSGPPQLNIVSIITPPSNTDKSVKKVSLKAQSPSRSPSPSTISGPTLLSGTHLPDKQVGQYIIKKTLGQGTFGKVKLGEHVETKKLAAIKIIEKANIKTTKQKVSGDREVRLMKLLHHPHVIGVHDVFETKHHIMIVMEHASGGELFDYIVTRGMVKEKEARHFFRQVVSAVDYCHRNSVIHRDLKPENLLLDNEKRIKIIDFGFGNTYSCGRLLDTYCGSPFYAAPEMIQGIRYIGPEVDIWSMGVILFALLSGRLPFDAKTMNDLYAKIAKGEYSEPSHFSSSSRHLISRMLQVDPKKRASLDEVRRHEWINEGYNELTCNHMRPREKVVTNPHPDSVQELVSYGFNEEESRKMLQKDVGLHPIVSLYHLIEEARQRSVSESVMPESSAQHSRPDAIRSTDTPQHLSSNHSSLALSNGKSPHSNDRHASELVVPNANATHHNSVNLPQRPASAMSHRTAQHNGYGNATRPSNGRSNSTFADVPVMSSIMDKFSHLCSNRAAATLNPASPDQRVPTLDIHMVADESSNGGNYGTIEKHQSESHESSGPLLHVSSHGQHRRHLSNTSIVSNYSYNPNKEIRTMKGFFNVSTTSVKPVPEILSEITAVLEKNGISYDQMDPFTYICEDTAACSPQKGNRFEIEIVRIDKLHTFGISLRRIRGSVWSHKKLMNRFISELKI